jgi:hypothetical protein
MVENPRSNCPDCEGRLQPIKLLDATEAFGSGQEANQCVELSYAAPDATPSFFFGKIPRLGVVKGFICPSCGRILLYGESSM